MSISLEKAGGRLRVTKLMKYVCYRGKKNNFTTDKKLLSMQLRDQGVEASKKTRKQIKEVEQHTRS